VAIALLILLVVFGSQHCSYAQNIPWQSSWPLTWDDFKAKKKTTKRKRSAATTCSRIYYTYNYDSAGRANVKVESLIIPERSWKKNSRLKPNLLKHEQVHFDITELYARKLRKAYGRYLSKHPSNSGLSAGLGVIYDRKHYQWRRCEHKYDRRTRHSRNKPVQQEWNDKVADQLHELSEYEVR